MPLTSLLSLAVLGDLPGGFHIGSDDTFWVVVGSIVLATFITEDVTSIAVGMMIGAKQLNPAAGLLGCFAGIFIGDFGLWLFGWLLGRHVLHYRWVQRYFPDERLERWREWFRRYGWATIIASRFLPGTRIPAFVGAGLVGGNIRQFLLWIGIAGLLWTPFIVVLAALFGAAVSAPLTRLFCSPILATIVALVVFIFLLHNTVLLFSRTGRCQIHARWARLWRYEFWPGWVFYLPLIGWILYLGLRYRGLAVVTAANPCIPASGMAGESKSEILDRLPQEAVVPYVRLRAATPAEAVERFEAILAERQWDYPLIVKPDASQRGVGLALVRSAAEVRRYFEHGALDAIVQVYHPGPHEAGIFYYRIPGEATGHIFSITHKVFPMVVGDGVLPLRKLIWRHPRYRFQARIYLERFRDQENLVIPAGEAFRLGVAGNHCQGTMFLDGSHLITPALEARIDAIARQTEGFWIGRFDVRYRDPEAFKAGTDLAIIELNGASAESTNLYDPSFSLLRAYRILFRQWELLYRIGAANARAGHPVTPVDEVWRQVRDYYRTRRIAGTVSQ